MKYSLSLLSLAGLVSAGVTELGKVTVLTESNFDSFLSENEAGALVEFYAPWCGHCKKLEPEWTKVGKKVKKEGLEDILTIAKMDGTANDSPNDAITWSGFPTIFYMKVRVTSNIFTLFFISSR